MKRKKEMELMDRLHTHCGRGHELTKENVYVNPKGNRQCRTCKLARNRDWRKKIKTRTPFTYCRKGHKFSPENEYIMKNGRRFCYFCHKERQKHQYIKNGGAAGRHGITIQELEQRWLKQNGKCAICEIVFEKRSEGVIDHNHKNNQVRGILCTNCNTALGKLGDSPKLLLKAIEYLNGTEKKI